MENLKHTPLEDELLSALKGLVEFKHFPVSKNPLYAASLEVGLAAIARAERDKQANAAPRSKHWLKWPTEIDMRIEDGGIENPTWADVLYACETGLDLIAENQDFYSEKERKEFKPMFQKWAAIAKAEGNRYG